MPSVVYQYRIAFLNGIRRSQILQLGDDISACSLLVAKEPDARVGYSQILLDPVPHPLSIGYSAFELRDCRRSVVIDAYDQGVQPRGPTEEQNE